MSLHIRSFINYATKARLPAMPEGQHLFLQAPARARRQTLREMISEGNDLATNLLLQGNTQVLAGLKQRERVGLWGGVLENKFLNYIAEYFRPTGQKVRDYFKAALTLEPAIFRDLPVEHAAHLMAYLSWDQVPARLQGHPVFANWQYTPLRQSVLALIRDRDGRHSNRSTETLCQATEAQFICSVDEFRVTLVNDHWLFSDGPEWKVGLTLRSVLSASGTLFPKGMFYFLSGRENWQNLIGRRVKRAAMPNLTWQPVRAFRPHYCRGNTVDELARLFPPAK
jgi:hypothetical protein